MTRENVQIALVMKDLVSKAWPVLAPWVIQALGETESWADIAQLREEAERGTTQVWVAHDKTSQEVLAVCLTEGVMLNGVAVLVVRWLGGRQMELWLEDIGIIERWGALQGFKRVEVWGRAGWSRALQPHGYRETYRVLEKTIDRGLH